MEASEFAVNVFDIGPLPLACLVISAGFIAARHWKNRNSTAYFCIQLVSFLALTVLLLNAGVVPYRMEVHDAKEPLTILIGSLKIIWWLGAAWLAIGFSGAFVVMSRQPREAKLLQNLLAGLVYVATLLAIFSYVFDWPVKGLLATSGAVAVILGLALQNSLGDVFSAIVLDIERPYRVGDWIILDEALQGEVIETNWRSTHVMTSNRDVAIIPNSIIAKSKLINCSVPTKVHGSSTRIKLDSSCPPAMACQIMNEALLSSALVLQTPKPSVTLQDISAELLDLDLSYSVRDVGVAGQAQSDLIERVARAIAIAGFKFASRLPHSEKGSSEPLPTRDKAQRLLAGIPLFATLLPGEFEALALQMVRREYEAGQVVVRSGTVMQSLCIIGSGVLAGTRMEHAQPVEIGRLASGEYFGENGLLTAEAVNADVTALTRATLFEISRDTVTDLLQRRPGIAQELSETLARRRLSMQSFDQPRDLNVQVGGFADRLAVKIRQLFSESRIAALRD